MSKKQKIKQKGNAYLKYSGIAFQMAGIILLSIFIGSKIDGWAETSQPYFTILIVLIAFTGYMYKLYIELMKPQ